jgi:hypothetical protein
VYFYNQRFKFKIPRLTRPIEGSIIAASAISAVDLQKRPFEKHSHLTRRFLDPQLYMASVDAAIDPQTVSRLAAYPWFHGHDVPKYDSDEYSTRTQWKKQHKADLLSKWTRTAPTDPNTIKKAAQAAVEFQLKIGCEGILLAVPLTTIVDQTLQTEIAWMEAGLEACAKLRVREPVFATVALSEAVLQVPALRNPILHSFANQVAARSELAGAYVVLEQADKDSYFWTSKDALMSLLVLTDDLYRGAHKRVLTNYVGTFGLVAKAVGAEVWSSGYYLMQRRFSLRGTMGRAYPRYHSLSLAGDIGLNEDLDRIQAAGFASQCMTASTADSVLRTALSRGRRTEEVNEWEYRQSNCSAAQQHYLEVVSAAGADLERMSRVDRQTWVHNWLENAVKLTRELKNRGLIGLGTTADHQQVWFDVFSEWQNYAKQ